VGNSSYPNFCSFGYFIDTTLIALEGKQILNIGIGDELCNQDESFKIWSANVFEVIL
jgi:hypothetical protein